MRTHLISIAVCSGLFGGIAFLLSLSSEIILAVALSGAFFGEIIGVVINAVHGRNEA